MGDAGIRSNLQPLGKIMRTHTALVEYAFTSRNPMELCARQLPSRRCQSQGRCGIKMRSAHRCCCQRRRRCGIRRSPFVGRSGRLHRLCSRRSRSCAPHDDQPQQEDCRNYGLSICRHKHKISHVCDNVLSRFVEARGRQDTFCAFQWLRTRSLRCVEVINTPRAMRRGD